MTKNLFFTPELIYDPGNKNILGPNSLVYTNLKLKIELSQRPTPIFIHVKHNLFSYFDRILNKRIIKLNDEKVALLAKYLPRISLADIYYHFSKHDKIILYFIKDSFIKCWIKNLPPNFFTIP